MPFWLAAFARLVPDLGEPASRRSCGSNFLCVEWEYQRVTLPRGTPRNIAQRLLTDAAERFPAGATKPIDPRLSLEERYGTHDGYVKAVKKAAANAVARGFLLQADADALITQADASNVLK